MHFVTTVTNEMLGDTEGDELILKCTYKDIEARSEPSTNV